MEDQRKRAEQEQLEKIQEVKRQQAEILKKQEEEKQKREEELEAKKQEQIAVHKIKAVLSRFKAVYSQEQFESAQAGLVKVLQEELEKTRSMKEKVKEEAETVVKQAQERVEKVAEQKRKEEEEKAKKEQDRKEACEKAAVHVKELSGLVDIAEEASKELAKEAEQLTEKDAANLKIDEINTTVKALNDEGVDAREKLKACTELLKQKGPEMKVLEQPGSKSEDTPSVGKLLTRISEVGRRVESTLIAVSECRNKAVKKHEAKKVADSVSKLFDKYDKDKDGMLSQREVKQYAKSELDFDASTEVIAAIWKFLVVGEEKGVRKERFHRLKMSIGIAREKAKDCKRKEARVEREKQITAMKEELHEKLKEALEEVKVADEKIKEAEKAAEPIPKARESKRMSSSLMTKLAEEVDGAVAKGRETYAEVKKSVAKVAEGVDDTELKKWIDAEVKKLEARMARFEGRLTKVAQSSTKFRDEAKKKVAAELKAFEKKIVTMLKYHQQQKECMSNEELFAAIDTNNDGKIDADEFIIFFQSTCEKEPAKKAEDDSTETPAEGVFAETEEEAISEENLRRAFAHFDEDDEGALTNDKFFHLVRVFMKVTKDTVVTDGLKIKESKTLRRLEVGEVVEVLEGPRQEEAVKVPRIRVLVMKDQVEGWVTTAGNQGTPFLEEGGSTFKVVAETIMTPTFVIDSSEATASTRKLKDTTRKLKVGEIVEVREWPKKEAKSGLMRMKCRTRSDGVTGFVTTVGNQGTVYLEVM